MRYNKDKLKVNLKLAINRLKMLQGKKNNQNAVLRKEIAALLEKGKEESARIKVEHVINEDQLIDACELLELYCDLLLARFGLIESMRTCDPGIEEAVCTVIWAAPRLSSDIRELTVVKELFAGKYGPEFMMMALENMNGMVNSRVMDKLSVSAPKSLLVTNYLVAIAQSHRVDWSPARDYEQEAEVARLEANAPEGMTYIELGGPRFRGSADFKDFNDEEVYSQVPPTPKGTLNYPPRYNDKNGDGNDSNAQKGDSPPAAATKPPLSPRSDRPLPSPPVSKSADPDLDDLAARFEALKKRS
eukprot:Clim_evm31s210 gene=Clim_evmTU31s210